DDDPRYTQPVHGMSNKPCRTVTGCRELHDLPLVAGVSSERHFGSVLICPKDIWVPLLIGVQGQFDGARSSSFITLSSPTARSQKRRLAALDCSDARRASGAISFRRPHAQPGARGRTDRYESEPDFA